MPAGTGARRKAGNKDMSKQFNEYFSTIYGKARWKALSSCLSAATSHVALINCMATGMSLEVLQETEQLVPVFSQGGIHCLRRVNDTGSYPPPSADPCTGLTTHYWMDLASVLPPLLLAVAPGHKVLDMCAAPGGKTLVLAQQLFGSRGDKPPISSSTGTLRQHGDRQQVMTTDKGTSDAMPPDTMDGQHVEDAHDASSTAPAIPEGLLSSFISQRSHLTANEVDRGRCTRLEGVLQQYLPLPLLSSAEGHAAVRVTCQAADKYWQRNEAEAYDRVLLDVPCSSDRHVVQQAAVQRGVITEAQWSQRGCSQLAALQLQLLLAGLRAVAPGGLLVYSTCSLAPVENDLVITQALARMPAGAIQLELPLQQGGAAIEPAQLRDAFGAEATSHGMFIAPDVKGAGPMYVCVLRKMQSTANVGYAARFGLLTISSQHDEAASDGESEESEEVMQ